MALWLAAAAWAPAHADQPLLRPASDVDVTYRAATPPGSRPFEQRVRWMALAQIMRIDPPTAGVHVIIDYPAKRMSVVRDATRSVIEMAAPDSIAGALGSGGTGYVRRGQATVAGRPCTEWQTQDRDAHVALVCITEDGVLLRAGTSDQVRVSAVSVRYAPQDPEAFRVPPDYVRRRQGATQ
ncbi:MAG: hypothetical protein WDN25_22485 [Acetobacteraceae bacterium]